MSLSLRSPAKVNLFLKIVCRRSDGYHELASLFQTIDLCDTLHIKTALVDQFTCSDPSLPLDDKNLVIKALNLFRFRTGINQAFAVHLDKKIPQQAGLGGGSSNAATTLWACNELCGHPVSLETLKSLAKEIGADVPFFLSTGTAYCTGIGEKLQELSPLPQTAMWIVKPQKGMSTPQVYRQLDIAGLQPRDPEQSLQRFLKGDPEYFNDLEPPAFALMPALAQLKEKLLHSGFSKVLMSGSGSSFFCIGESDLSQFSDCLCCQTRFINRSPSTWYRIKNI